MRRIIFRLSLSQFLLLAGEPAIADNYVAYVEDIVGSVTSGSNDLNVLDPLENGAHISLGPGSQVRICHYTTRDFLTLKGPVQAVVSSEGVTTTAGKASAIASGRCALPVVSTVQGGVALRKLGYPATDVALRPKIKIRNTSQQPIRRLTLENGAQEEIGAFDRHYITQPHLAEGGAYLLLIQFADGSEWKMTLHAHANAETSTVIITFE